TKTIRVVLSPDSESTSLSLWYQVWACLERANQVKVKEKAYGLIIKGPAEEVEAIVKRLREIDGSKVFISEAMASTNKHRVFRGFLQLSGEYQSLPLISQAPEKTSKYDGEVKVKGKLIRCRYVGQRAVDALLIDYGDGKIKVRCPEMVFYGSHVCGLRCPYGELRYP
ncbi:MAG: DUF2102 domain-containing protein, partial [Nitrososphaerota archaeon]